ncbi:MAG TPA: prepilin-type N-terminal cleavage/methylation domain-containing protein [Burkholderiales bacterium]|nr:prepilin-type N-terminal cleavage/methylation domain-containing protein [Burkholderiales bacterium]
MKFALHKAGFTLIELAVAIFVLMLLLGSLIVPLTTQVEQRKVSETRKALDEAREALLGFAAANGRLPCPASSASNGNESFAAGGSAADGNCSNFFDGFLPAAALGLAPTDALGFAVDGWGLVQNRIRYAVSKQTVNGVTNALTRSGGMSAAGLASLAASQLLYVCGSGIGVNAGTNCGTAVTLSSNAVAIIYSVGANAATGGTSAHELENPNPNGGSADRIFVSRDWSTASGSEFDDMVTWIGTNPLFSRLIAAGQLP